MSGEDKQGGVRKENKKTLRNEGLPLIVVMVSQEQTHVEIYKIVQRCADYISDLNKAIFKNT